MRISISQVKDYLTCPTMSYNLHVLHRGKDLPSEALDIGNLVHEYFAARLLGHAPPGMDAPYSVEAKEYYISTLLPSLTALELPNWEIVAVEKALQSAPLVGRLDALVKWNDKYWSVQYKTVSPSTNLVHFSEMVRIGWHECAYEHLAVSNGYIPFGGTILVTIRKLSNRKAAEGIQPIAIHYLARESNMQNKRISDLIDLVWTIESSYRSRSWRLNHEWALQNVDSCMGKYGNARCQYWDVCHGTASLADPEFVDLPDRYADLEEQNVVSGE